MISIFKLLMFIIFIIGGCSFLIVAIKSYLLYNNFRNYLLSINDKEMFNKVKILNPLGKRTFFAMFSEIHWELLEKYKQTGDDNYLLFYEKEELYEKLMGIILVFLFMLFITYQIVMPEVSGTKNSP